MGKENSGSLMTGVPGGHYAGKGSGDTQYGWKCPALGPSVPLVALQPSEAFTHVQRETCQRMFFAALFLLTKNWK